MKLLLGMVAFTTGKDIAQVAFPKSKRKESFQLHKEVLVCWKSMSKIQNTQRIIMASLQGHLRFSLSF